MHDHSGHSHARAIDIHAHYFAQSYLDLFNEQKEKYGTEYRSTKEGWYFKAPIGGMGPLPTRIIDIKQRVAEMDADWHRRAGAVAHGADGLLGRA